MTRNPAYESRRRRTKRRNRAARKALLQPESCKKNPYVDRYTANMSILVLIKKGILTSEARAYECDHPGCGKWHITRNMK